MVVGIRTTAVCVAWLGFLAGCGDYGSNSSGLGGSGGVSGSIAGGTGGLGGVITPGGSGAGGSDVGPSAGTGGSTSGGTGGSVQGGFGGTGGSGGVITPEPGSEAREAERDALDEELDDLGDLDATTLEERYPTRFEAPPTYDTTAVTGLDTIQNSALALSAAQLQMLSQRGFVISGTRSFPTFAYGYASIYAEDLPVYISADSILDTVHRSFDRVLQHIESSSLVSEMTLVLDGMRAGLQSGVGAELGSEVRADADTFLAVASSLLGGTVVVPVAGGSADDIANFVSLANAATGIANVELFGIARPYEDFSQFKPRGHYTDSETLRGYFRAMMWLGRIDFRLFETQMDGSRVFHRRQVEGMLLMNALVTSELRTHLDNVDRVIQLFVGDPDYMELSEVGLLLDDVGATSLTDVPNIDDATFEQAIVDGAFGTQQISSHIMINGMEQGGTMPLNLSFALLGQRYVIDSHVFSNVVFDRVQKGEVLRMMPSPLDVAFAVFQNDQAAALLAPELETYPYAPDLAAMRVLADKHPPEFWNGTLYNLWLGALRELSPINIAKSENADALPATFKTEAWGRRLLQGGLASWAQLRHNTLLYAKQAYTGGNACEFPDGYVDPYPEFFAKLAEYAARGREAVVPLLSANSPLTTITTYFDNLLAVTTSLRDMAIHQRTGAPYTQEMLDFINDAVVVDPGCGDDFLSSGWYSKLFFHDDPLAWSPTIADVHTQPTDELGNFVGNVLHVGTGDARLMVVIADTCSGPRAYAGLASSYQELVRTNFERLDDLAWEEMVRSVGDVAWAEDLTVFE